MSYGVLFVLAVVAGAAILLVTERFPIDQVAAAVPVVLLLGGVVTVEQALSGLSHPATVTVAAMLALGAGISKTGGVAALARWMRRASPRSTTCGASSPTSTSPPTRRWWARPSRTWTGDDRTSPSWTF